MVKIVELATLQSGSADVVIRGKKDSNQSDLRMLTPNKKKIDLRDLNERD
jgi:hypothetical protein